MHNFLSINDIDDIQKAIYECQRIKQKPYEQKNLGLNKRLGLLFMNPSLRTKLSTVSAAQNLGMDILPIDVNQGGWALEFADGAVMNKDKVEHIKEAVQVISRYSDMIAIRSFAKLRSYEEDAKELLFDCFTRYANKPVINLESALRHPLQTLADILTIEEHKHIVSKNKVKPKVVMTWAPHVKALPHAVPNSFVEGMKKMDYEFVITHPKGYELDPNITENVAIEYDQQKALKDADFIYVKNWSSFTDYGQITNKDIQWTLTQEKLINSPEAKVMHCLPVRRNLVIADNVLDSESSIVIEQAENRLYTAQYVLSELLRGM